MVVLCFPESPYQSYFMAILCKLWGILSEKNYGMIISILTTKTFINYETENKVFDYGYLLLELLEQTPEHYKRYIFTDNGSRNEGKELLLAVLQKKPFEQRDVEIIKNILKHATVNERKSILYSQCGENICNYLLEERNREIIDLILPDCLSEDEIIDFKKRTLLSYNMIMNYFVLLEQGKEEVVVSLLNWGCFPEDPNFKLVLIQTQDFKKVIKTLLLNSEMNYVNRTLEWCFSSVCTCEQFKKQFVRDYLCDTKVGIINRPWNINAFIQWCGMLSEEIVELKKDILFSRKSYILKLLFLENLPTILFSLEWLLSDADILLSFKEKFEEYLIEVNYSPFYHAKNIIDDKLHQLITYRIRALARNAPDAPQYSQNRI